MAKEVVHDKSGNATFPIVINDPDYFSIQRKQLEALEQLVGNQE